MNGFQVAPAELEAVLLENEHIADAGVVGIKWYTIQSQFLFYTNISTVTKKSSPALTSPSKRSRKEK